MNPDYRPSCKNGHRLGTVTEEDGSTRPCRPEECPACANPKVGAVYDLAALITQDHDAIMRRVFAIGANWKHEDPPKPAKK